MLSQPGPWVVREFMIDQQNIGSLTLVDEVVPGVLGGHGGHAGRHLATQGSELPLDDGQARRVIFYDENVAS